MLSEERLGMKEGRIFVEPVRLQTENQDFIFNSMNYIPFIQDTSQKLTACLFYIKASLDTGMHKTVMDFAHNVLAKTTGD